MNERESQNSSQQHFSQQSDIYEKLWGIEAKLKILKHCLLHTEELDENILLSLGYLIDDIEEGVARVIDYCEKTETPAGLNILAA